MTFSPRARPHTVNLSFTDPDLTDTYRDDRTTSSFSSPRHRHARGDTPLSRRQGTISGDESNTSVARWSSSRQSIGSASAGEGGSEADGRAGGAERSNLDKLLDFLDEDDHEGPQAAQPLRPRTVATSTPPPSAPSTRPRPAPTTSRRKEVLYSPSACAQPPLSSSHVSPSIAESHTATSFAPTESPSMRAARSVSYRPSSASASRPSSALAMFGRANGSRTGGRAMDGLPDSPSPRPGSVAALRKSEGDRSNFAEGTSKGKEREPEYLDGVSLQEDGTEPSVDSITRVAEAALKEFEGIVSRGTSLSSRHDRPPSRLRNIRSPTPSPSPPATKDLRTSPSTGPSNDDVDATYTQQHFQQPRHPPPSHSEQDVNTQLVAELRDAQDYIAYLQDELRAISDVVVQLREVPEVLPPPNGPASHSAPSPKPHTPPLQPTRPAAAELTRASQEAFEVVKHLVTLLPSVCLSPSSQISTSAQSHASPSAPASLHSLSLALRFTRSLDALVHHGQKRRDEDVFEEGNLGRIERRVRGWERAVREGVGRAGEEVTEDRTG